MSEANSNIEQRPGCEQPQAPRARTVESVDDGNHPLNIPEVSRPSGSLNIQKPEGAVTKNILN